MREQFDLVNEPWIRVRSGSKIEEVSLLQLFDSAHEFDSLAGELPTQDVAVLRILEVILQRVFNQPGRYTDDIWGELWEADSLPIDRIRTYLDEHHDRFDLLHPQTPFFQVAGLSAAKTSGLLKLITDVPDGIAYFTTRMGHQLTSMPYGEAARWLVHCQAYDVSGIKTGAIGDDRVKGGRGYPIGTGPCGRMGVIVLEGANLKETLLLNLVLTYREGDAAPDLPVWERAPLTAAVESAHPEPLGPADWMTWPIRRILLHHNGSGVTDVLLSNGDPIHVRNKMRVESMTAWRRSPTQEKMTGLTVVYMPRVHDTARSFWRGLEGVLVGRAEGGRPSEHADSLAPGVLEWIASLRAVEKLDRDHPMSIRAVGLGYGTQDGSVASAFDDSLRTRASVLTDERLQHLATEAVRNADEAVQSLAHLAADLASASGRTSEGARDAARERGFFSLDAPYRRWFSELSSATDPDDALTRWQQIVRSHVLDEGDELVVNAGEVAWKGRIVRDRPLNSPIAQRKFYFALRKALPLAYVKQEETG